MLRLTEGQIELRQELAVRNQRGRDEVRSRNSHLFFFSDLTKLCFKRRLLIFHSRRDKYAQTYSMCFVKFSLHLEGLYISFVLLYCTVCVLLQMTFTQRLKARIIAIVCECVFV